MNSNYDYIICGAGCAGLSLAYRFASDVFSDKRILLIEKATKDTNDRTWCYWEKENGLFDPLVYTSWQKLNIFAGDYHDQLNIQPYTYKMIRGIDFYEYCFKKIKTCAHIEVIHDTVQTIKSFDQGASVMTNMGIYTASFVFSSIISGEINKNAVPYVLQHFRGWFLRSKTPVFDPEVANFMDFRVSQENETRFFYVLPKTKYEALVELAVFSSRPWVSQFYDIKIDQFLREHIQIGAYEILETENGIIPMTTYPFEIHNTSRCIHIGTAGGMVKASTGFAFDRIQKHSEYIIQRLKADKSPEAPEDFYKNKFRWFDKVLLKVLINNYASSDEVFKDLYRKNKIVDVLEFLNEQSNSIQILKILSAPPKWPFIRAALNF